MFFGTIPAVFLGVIVFLWQMLKRPRMPCSWCTDTGCLGNLWWSSLAVNDRKRRNRGRRKGGRRGNERKYTRKMGYLWKNATFVNSRVNVTVYLFFVHIMLPSSLSVCSGFCSTANGTLSFDNRTFVSKYLNKAESLKVHKHKSIINVLRFTCSDTIHSFQLIHNYNEGLCEGLLAV